MDKRERFKRRMNERFMDENWQKHQRNAKIAAGLLVITAGVLILFRQLGVFVPQWVVSWKMILIAIGFITLIRHNFKNTGGYIMVLIGSIFLIKDIIPDWIEPKFIWPVIIIGAGIGLIAKTIYGDQKKKSILNSDVNLGEIDSEDFIQAGAFFGGITKNIVSKNFKGADVSSVFGGTELNLLQTDFNEKAVIDINCVFGGVTLIVPSDWKIKSDLTTVFGGIEDKRSLDYPNLINESKTLILKGTCVFGGIELLSYE